MPGQFILYNKSKIYFRREGYGKPVLLIHGFGEDGSVWQNQVDALKDKYLLIIPDLPGSGQSEILDGNNFEIENGIEIYARVIKFILDHLGISS